MTHSVYDSLIFDMDGTLWDAVDSYAAVWNRTIDQLSVNRKHVMRNELLEQMGRSLPDICATIIPGLSPQLKAIFLQRLAENENLMMPILGGALYPGVKETIPMLAQKYKLFLVSNCGDKGLINFMSFSQLTPYITDTLTYGETNRDKTYNIRAVIERHLLRSPLYIGDTQSDADASHKANVPFGWVSYGFGTCTGARHRFDTFTEIPLKILS